ncbi:OmpA family protein [Leptolyngbya sp. FACHB-261]|uniref:OmpA family protein n=1 Tax=Leptolyngbya sp. FACHB-261 TaxID=2692806 RepID=UPI0016823240|nr:OmpA family protein [Leptolyngbya sp. FACHB-261]MBD2103728.1 OmpA family protein [Leptolyngbya sp. FACHB-261]
MSKQIEPALMKTLAIIAGVTAAGLWVLGGLVPRWLPNAEPSVSQSVPAGQSLALLGDTFSGYSTFRSPSFQKALKGVGVDLRYADEFNQTKRAELLNQGQSDLLATTLDQFLKQRPEGQIVALIDRTAGADAVVLNTKKYPNLKSLLNLQQLVAQARPQGQSLRMAFAGDTPSEYLALLLDTKFEAFNLADFQISKVADASDAWQLLQDPNSNVAIAVLWEPFVTQARQQGYTVVLSSKDVPGAIVDVLVASKRLVQSQPSTVSKFVETYYQHIDAGIRNTSQLQAQIAEDSQLSTNSAATVLQGIDFFTALEAQGWLTNGTLQRRIGSTAGVLVLAGHLNQVPQDTTSLFTAQFISQAATASQTLIDLVRADNPELADRLIGKSVTAAVPRSLAQLQNAPDIGNLRVRGAVSFAVGSTQLTTQGKQTLNQLAQEIAEFNAQTVAVRVIGHTSHSGIAATNQAISQQRAQVVAAYLRNRGLKHNITAEGKGFSQPLPSLAPNDPRNQRTEIRLIRVN